MTEHDGHEVSRRAARAERERRARRERAELREQRIRRYVGRAKMTIELIGLVLRLVAELHAQGVIDISWLP